MYKKKDGFTLIDVILSVAILVLAFGAIFGALQASVQLVSVSKARSGGIALANQQLEILRSLSYDDVGTIAGIPSGLIAQNSTTTINGIEYGIRTLVQFVDAPQDGTGAGDANSITADYKVAKVEVTWNARDRQYNYELVTNIVPRGIETLAGGGTLTINVFDAVGGPVDSADVRIVNDTTTSTIDVTVSSNASGTASFPGAPAASDYEVYVKKVGYSSAETYTATTSLPNPNPGHATVSVGDTTTVSFSIDQVSSLTINTFEPFATTTYTDTFSSGAGIASSTPNIAVLAGQLQLNDPGTGYSTATGSVESVNVTPANLITWDEFRFSSNTPASTTAYVRLHDFTGTIIPDGDLPGNSSGLVSPVDLSGLSTSTYPTLEIFADLKTDDASTTPAILDWEIEYSEGPVILPNVAFSYQGTKTIGTDAGAQPVYKVSESDTTDGSGTYSTTTLEWDSYAITVDDSATGYDIAQMCPPQPQAISPNTNVVTDITLVADTPHTLLVTVRDNTGGYVQGAGVRVHRVAAPAYDTTATSTGNCGQILFENVPEGTVGGGNAYNVDVTAIGFTADNQTDIEVSNISSHNVTLFP